MKRKIISAILLISWMVLIFWFSSNNATKSSSLSSGLIKNAIKLVDKDISNDKLDEKVQDYSFPVRKMAHFTLYLVLGILSYNFLLCYKIKKIVIISIIICFLYAISDEIHQLFSFERSGNIIDVGIDTCGSIIGVYLINKIFKKKKNMIY